MLATFARAARSVRLSGGLNCRFSSSSTTAGRLYTWGTGAEGQLGYDVSTSADDETRGSKQKLPRQVFLEDGSSPIWKQVGSCIAVLSCMS